MRKYATIEIIVINMHWIESWTHIVIYDISWFFFHRVQCVSFNSSICLYIKSNKKNDNIKPDAICVCMTISCFCWCSSSDDTILNLTTGYISPFSYTQIDHICISYLIDSLEYRVSLLIKLNFIISNNKANICHVSLTMTNYLLLL